MGSVGDRLTGVGAGPGLSDEVFEQLVLARIIEPTSKLDTIRVLEEIGIPAVSYPTINRRLARYATEQWRARIATSCAAHAGLGPATLVLYDVTTLYFETDEGDGSASQGSARSNAWSHRSLSACWPMPADSR